MRGRKEYGSDPQGRRQASGSPGLRPTLLFGSAALPASPGTGALSLLRGRHCRPVSILNPAAPWPSRRGASSRGGDTSKHGSHRALLLPPQTRRGCQALTLRQAPGDEGPGGKAEAGLAPGSPPSAGSVVLCGAAHAAL